MHFCSQGRIDLWRDRFFLIWGIIGEKLCDAKIINLPTRLKALSAEERKRKAVHDTIKAKRAEREARREAARAVKEEKEAAKAVWATRLGNITAQVKEAGYCKRDLPSLNQIKAFLKKEHGATKETLDAINENNVDAQFAAIVQGSWVLNRGHSCSGESQGGLSMRCHIGANDTISNIFLHYSLNNCYECFRKQLNLHFISLNKFHDDRNELHDIEINFHAKKKFSKIFF